VTEKYFIVVFKVHSRTVVSDGESALVATARLVEAKQKATEGIAKIKEICTDLGIEIPE
jgi:hypothetical protein